MNKLKFSFYNRKLNHLADRLNYPHSQVICFDLPAGYTCQGANLCQCWSHRKTGKLIIGKHCTFHCYAAKVECRYPNVRMQRWFNYDLLRQYKNNVAMMTSIIEYSLPNPVKIIRIHSSGDFFNQDYFTAWLNIAKNHSEISFFAYSKIPYCVRNAQNTPNFHMVYSHGGKYDDYATGLPFCRVINSQDQAQGLPIACKDNPTDDYDYILAGESFCIFEH